MDFDEVLVKEIPGLCRCCLSDGCYKDMLTEFHFEGQKEIYADMLLECFAICINQQVEGFNSQQCHICDACIFRLRDACHFKRQVLESEKKFLDMVASGNFSPKVAGIRDMKIEPAEENEEFGPNLEGVEFGGDTDSDEPLKPPAKRLSKPKITVDALAVKRRKHKKSTCKLQKASKVAKFEAGSALTGTKGVKLKGRRESFVQRRLNLQIIFNNTTVIPFRWRANYRCFYCSAKVGDYDELRKHTNTHGDCSLEDHSIKTITGGPNMEVKIDISNLSCKICEEEFEYLDDILNHLIEKHDIIYNKTVDMCLEEYKLAGLTCQLCQEKFTYFGYLVSHMNNIHPTRCYICEMCKQKFNKKRDLRCHVKYYHREGGYQCEFCPHKFSTLNILRKHKSNRHMTRCGICFLKLPSAALKQKHMDQEHPEDDSLQCYNCFKTFRTKQGLKMHSRKCKTDVENFEDICNGMKDYDSADDNYVDKTVQREILNKLKENIVAVINMSTAVPFSFYKNKFNCFYCSEDFTDSDAMREHTVMAHPVCDLTTKYIKKNCRQSNVAVKLDISSLSCKVCYESMADLDTLLEHLNIKHKVNLDKSLNTFLQPYRLIKDHMACPHCPNQEFRFFCTLLKHVNSTHTNNNIICVYCGLTFRREHLLRVHIWRHHKEGQFRCNICDAECSMPSRLNMHMAKIHGVKSAKCSKCGEKFSTQYLRQKHMIEAHDLGHKCSYCGKLFVRNSFMKDHIRRTHLKEKNVECTVCAMKFFNNVQLRHHLVKHNGEKNFHCDICGERFMWRKGLVRHMGRHNKMPNAAAVT